jgi:hypothetical protein
MLAVGRSTLWLALLAAAVPLPVLSQRAQAAQGQPTQRFVGCYALELGEWSLPFPSEWPKTYRHPPTFRLHAGNESVRKVTPEVPTTSDAKPFDSWRNLSPSSVLISWSTGSLNLWLSVQEAPDGTLSGTASAFLDSTLARPHPRAAATARPISCAGVKL